jgi:uncharacterized protein (TIGR03437 family)
MAQVNVAVPALPLGDYPMVVTLGGFSSNSALVSIH